MKITLERLDKIIIMRFEGMIESYRGRGIVCTHNDITITSYNAPSLSNITIFLPGNSKEFDVRPGVMTFLDNDRRDKQFSKFKEALEYLRLFLIKKGDNDIIDVFEVTL